MSSMAGTIASRVAAAEARHGLRHEAADTAIAELKAAAAAAARLKAEPSALPLVCSCVLYTGIYNICSTEYLVEIQISIVYFSFQKHYTLVH